MRKTGSRRIVVDDVAYRWTMRRRPTYEQGVCWEPMSLTVMANSGRGSALVLHLDRMRPDNWLNLSGPKTSAVLPAEIAALIRRALIAGWHPELSGPRFVLKMSVDP